MNDIIIALFTGPLEHIDRAMRLANRAGFHTTVLRGAREDVQLEPGYVELLDVLTDPQADSGQWRRRTTAIATALMATFHFKLLSVHSPQLP